MFCKKILTMERKGNVIPYLKFVFLTLDEVLSFHPTTQVIYMFLLYMLCNKMSKF
jgi:hypothetical protein